MKIIEPYIIIEDEINGNKILKNLERYGRVCYKSEEKITENSSRSFIKRIIDSGHESILEHEKITIRIICDRGASHELVRHRVGVAFSQESTRYCNYSDSKFGNELTFINPCFWKESSIQYDQWKSILEDIEKVYKNLLSMDCSPQEARSVLPNSLKTEIITTMNLRAWRHFFKLRTSIKSHPQMRQIACMILDKFKELIPVIFDDIGEYK